MFLSRVSLFAILFAVSGQVSADGSNPKNDLVVSEWTVTGNISPRGHGEEYRTYTWTKAGEVVKSCREYRYGPAGYKGAVRDVHNQMLESRCTFLTLEDGDWVLAG